MNIQTVAENLRNTIAGKEGYLKALTDSRKAYDSRWEPLKAAVNESTIKFLEVNIDELKRILQDVEQCAKQASDDSWITNPDRSGGAFTDEEIARSSEWR